MDQFEELLGIIKTISEYLLTGKMACDQAPVEDVVYIVQEHYKRAGIDPSAISEVFVAMLTDAIRRDDRQGMSNTLRTMIAQCQILTELYGVKSTNFDLKLYPYKAKLHYYQNLEKNRSWLEDHPDFRKDSSFSGRGAVYTAITGGYDALHEPAFIDETLDYYLFTDSDDVKSDFYKVIKVENAEGLSPVKLSKMIKIIGNWEYLSDYDFTVWMDGKLQLTGDLRGYIGEYSKGAPLLCFNHYNRDDLYQEALECAQINADDPDLIERQISRYRAEGFPEHFGLIDACLLIKDNRSELLKKTMYDWWSEVKDWAKRDQLSFSYVCWKNGLIYDTSPLLSIDNPIVRTFKHTI